jgi:hypothetical protein
MARTQRDETAKAQLKVRLPAELRAKFEAEAKRHEHSLNAEVVLSLESALYYKEQGVTVFGNEDIFATVDTIAYLIRGFEKHDGKKLREDFENILRKSVEALISFMKVGQGSQKAGEYSVRDGVSMAVAAMIQAAEMVRKTIKETAPSSEKTEER